MTATFRMTIEEYEMDRNDNLTYCLYCGEPVWDIEPDARQRDCEHCQTENVYGIEELLMMGEIDIIEEEEDSL